MKRVFITRRLPAIAKSILLDHFAVDENPNNEAIPAERLPQLVADYDAILSTVADRFDEGVLRRKVRLQALSNFAVGLDNIDRGAAAEMGIAVYNTPGVVTESTADLTFALLLSLVRRIEPAREFVRQGRWQGWDPERFLGEELRGKVLGILGFGQIGQAVARRAIGFGLRVIHHRAARPPVDDLLRAHVTEVGLDDLLAESDYLALHVPLTPETKGLINAAAFAKMRRRPVVLNMARGDVIVTDALVNALRSGAIRGCGLDVVTAEGLSREHPLASAENVIVVPHIGTATVECRSSMARMAALNIVDHFRA